MHYEALYTIIIVNRLVSNRMENLKVRSADKDIIAYGLKEASKIMGISQVQLAAILQVDKSSLSRAFKNGIEPGSLKAQVSILIIRMYRSLFAISGDNSKFMKHFLNTQNRAFSSKPIDMIKNIEGLVQVNQYLDAMRGKV